MAMISQDITFNDLENHYDIYYMIILFIFNFKKNELYSEKDIKDLKNYTLANPRALLDDKIKIIIDRCLVCGNIYNYFGIVEKFVCCYPNGSPVRCVDNIKGMYSSRIKIINEISTCTGVSNYNYYNTNYKYLIYIEFFEFTNEIRKIIYDNIQNFIIKYNRKDDKYNFNRIRYWDILAQILNICNMSTYFDRFQKLFVILIKNINKDLIKLNIDSIDRTQILKKFIKSLDWTDSTNKIFYGERYNKIGPLGNLLDVRSWTNHLLRTKSDSESESKSESESE